MLQEPAEQEVPVHTDERTDTEQRTDTDERTGSNVLADAVVRAEPSDAARAEVRAFFARTATLTPAEAAALRRGPRRRARAALTTDPAFLGAVRTGAWSAGHQDAAREIRGLARTQALALARWPHRAALARALEEAALAVLSGADADGPLPSDLRSRLTAPYERATGAVLVPSPRSGD